VLDVDGTQREQFIEKTVAIVGDRYVVLFQNRNDNVIDQPAANGYVRTDVVAGLFGLQPLQFQNGANPFFSFFADVRQRMS
jgi:hypothetical protein